MERLRKLKLSFQPFGYYYSKRIVPNAADSTALLVSERFDQCKPHLPLIHQHFTKSSVSSSSSYDRQRFAADSLIGERFTKCQLRLPLFHRNLTKSRGFSSYSHVPLNFSPKSKRKRDLGLDEAPVVTYHGDSTVVESNHDEITDESFKENRRKISGWMTETGHLKGLNWLVVVVDKPEQEAYTFGGGIIVVSSGLLENHSNVETAAVLAHEVGHCVAQHVVDSSANAVIAAIHNLKNGIDIHPSLVKIHQWAEKEADYIALQLMASAGYDPHMYENLEINSEYEENGPISLKGIIQLGEDVQTKYKLQTKGKSVIVDSTNIS